MTDAFICDYVRTPFGRFAGALASARADDLGAVPTRALTERNKGREALDEVFYGCANQTGEDNRNVARMALLLAGLPTSVPGVTLNRLCGSGMDAVVTTARAICAGEIDIAIAGGLESMARAPFREDGGSVTAGNASGVNDGAAALIVASETAARKYGLTPIVRILGGATAGVAPRIMGMGPAPAQRKLCERLGLKPSDFDVVELNEAFASQGIAILRELGLAEGRHVNPNGGAIALGHPLGASGARITGTAALELAGTGGRRALATMCIGVGQGIAIALDRV